MSKLSKSNKGWIKSKNPEACFFFKINFLVFIYLIMFRLYTPSPNCDNCFVPEYCRSNRTDIRAKFFFFFYWPKRFEKETTKWRKLVQIKLQTIIKTSRYWRNEKKNKKNLAKGNETRNDSRYYFDVNDIFEAWLEHYKTQVCLAEIENRRNKMVHNGTLLNSAKKTVEKRFRERSKLEPK